MPLGHVATGILVNKIFFKRQCVTAAVLGALLPDALDRTLHLILRLTRSSHHIGHTPLAVAGLSLAFAGAISPRFAVSLASSYLTHLVTDDFHHGRVPWLLPFSDYRRLPRSQGRARIRNWVVGFALEIPSAWILYELARPKDQAQSSPQASGS